MFKKLKLSLVNVFLLFFIITLIFTFILSSTALYFNHQLVKNQNLLLTIISIENSLFKMSNARGKFLVRQQKILTADEESDLTKLESRLPIEDSFIKGQDSLISLTNQAPALLLILQNLKVIYQDFLQNDDSLMQLTRAFLKTKIELSNKKNIINAQIKQMHNQSENISGNLSYQYVKNIRLLHGYLEEGKLLQSEEMKASLRNLILSKISEAHRIDEKINTDLATLIGLTEQIAEEENSDELANLKNNQLLQLTPLIRNKLVQLNDLLQDNHELHQTASNLIVQMDLINTQLINESSGIYTLRKELNTIQEQLKHDRAQVENNIVGIATQFENLNIIVKQLQEKSLKIFYKILLTNRIIMVSMLLGIFLFISIVGYIIFRATSTTLKSLSHAMHKITQNENGLNERLNLTPYDDLNQVITAFNMMVESLHYTQGHLHELVASRTTELQNVNQNLESLVFQLNEAKKNSEVANKAKSQFIANTSHELRTPLNAIIGYSELLKEEMLDAGHHYYLDDLNKVESSAKHLLALINDILDLSKIEAGKIDVFLEDVNLPNMINELEGIITPLMKKNENTFKTEIDPNVGIMHTDLVKLRQCLLNLISNAAKFTKEGTITLVIKPSIIEGKSYMQFSVRDTGIGLTEEHLGKLFKAFSQAESSTTRRFGGTGLGLFLTKSFCEILGGIITIDSKYGKGSSFNMMLPIICTLEETTTQQISSLPDSNRPKTVLVVDEDPNIHKIMQEALNKENIQVQHAFHKEECIALARKYHPDLITLDVISPKVDGWSTLSSLKCESDLANIPVILVSMLLDKDLGFALGALDYLSKPVEPKVLMDKIEHLLPHGSINSILIVDDEEDSQQIIQRGINKAGWEILKAKNGREALECLEQKLPSIILLDLLMPEMDGFDVIRELQKHEKWSKIPVIIISSKELTPKEREFLIHSSKVVLKNNAYSLQNLIANITDQIKQILKIH